ncbi:DUF7682 family zinc-binding protein [Paraburkholderia sp. RL17-337-BIB-A]|uniref:DUF7682 family zinc-binding protein n=1 Tax=Paraburkholderia sp. RL17-337-BIB-A TaxID=3031636 RepID=UPI0038B99C11
MKRTFECGHSGKGKYCHTCESIAKKKDADRAAREKKRAARIQAADADTIDLSAVAHLAAVQREARDLLSKVQGGMHPYALNGKPIKSCDGKLLSVPVGRSYRLMFESGSLRPLRLISMKPTTNTSIPAVLCDRRDFV